MPYCLINGRSVDSDVGIIGVGSSRSSESISVCGVQVNVGTVIVRSSPDCSRSARCVSDSRVTSSSQATFICKSSSVNVALLRRAPPPFR